MGENIWVYDCLPPLRVSHAICSVLHAVRARAAVLPLTRNPTSPGKLTIFLKGENVVTGHSPVTINVHFLHHTRVTLSCIRSTTRGLGDLDLPTLQSGSHLFFGFGAPIVPFHINYTLIPPVHIIIHRNHRAYWPRAALTVRTRACPHFETSLPPLQPLSHHAGAWNPHN